MLEKKDKNKGYEGTRVPWHPKHGEGGKPSIEDVNRILEARTTRAEEASAKEAARATPTETEVPGGETEAKAPTAPSGEAKGAEVAPEVAPKEDVEVSEDVVPGEGGEVATEVETPEGEVVSEEAVEETPKPVEEEPSGSRRDLATAITNKMHDRWREGFQADKGSDAERYKPVPHEGDAKDAFEELSESYKKLRLNDGVLEQDINQSSEGIVPSLSHKLNGAPATDYSAAIHDVGKVSSETDAHELASAFHDVWKKHNEWQKDSNPELFKDYEDLPNDEKAKDLDQVAVGVEEHYGPDSEELALVNSTKSKLMAATEVETPEGEVVSEEAVEETPEGEEAAEFVAPKDSHLRENVIKAGGTPRENIEVRYSDQNAEGAHSSVKKGVIRVGKNNRELPVKYGLVHIDDILASHRYEPGAKGLVSNEDKGYPSVGQHREGEYDTAKVKQAINRAAGAPGQDEEGEPTGFRAVDVVDPTHGPNDGPPTIYMDGVVAGGTNRSAIIKRLFKEGRGKFLTDHLKREAKSLGQDPAAIEDGWIPARVIQKNHHDMTGDELTALSRDLNPEVSKGKNKATVAADLSNQLGPVLKHLGAFHVDDHTSINSFINTNEGKPIREVIEKIVGTGNPDWFDEKGNLTPEGKAPLNRALAVSALNGNSKLYSSLNKEGVKSQADKYHNLAPYALAAPLVVKEGGEKFDLSKELELAADAYKEVRDLRNDLKGGCQARI